jgi:hypothetical protein
VTGKRLPKIETSNINGITSGSPGIISDYFIPGYIKNSPIIVPGCKINKSDNCQVVDFYALAFDLLTLLNGFQTKNTYAAVAATADPMMIAYFI